MTVTAGSVERTDFGTLEAHLWSLVPIRALQELNEMLGLDQMTLSSQSGSISADLAAPTRFEGTRRTILPRGIAVLNMLDWRTVVLPANITAVVHTLPSSDGVP